VRGEDDGVSGHYSVKKDDPKVIVWTSPGGVAHVVCVVSQRHDAAWIADALNAKVAAGAGNKERRECRELLAEIGERVGSDVHADSLTEVRERLRRALDYYREPKEGGGDAEEDARGEVGCEPRPEPDGLG
jgi:hypothetical protein